MLAETHSALKDPGALQKHVGGSTPQPCPHALPVLLRLDAEMQEGRQKAQRPQDRFLFLNTQMSQVVGILSGGHFSPISTENRGHLLLTCTDGTACVPVMHRVSWHRKQVFRASVVLLQKSLPFFFFFYLDEGILWRMMSPTPQTLRSF